jgi:hypothetical protein
MSSFFRVPLFADPGMQVVQNNASNCAFSLTEAQNIVLFEKFADRILKKTKSK